MDEGRFTQHNRCVIQNTSRGGSNGYLIFEQPYPSIAPSVLEQRSLIELAMAVTSAFEPYAVSLWRNASVNDFKS